MAEQLLRVREVCQTVGLGRSTIYAKEARGEFPKRVELSERAVAWKASEVQAWIEQRQPKMPVAAAA